MKITGVYKITNSKNGMVYIGSSEDMLKREKEHMSNLKRKTHHNKILQNDFIKYGEDSFYFEILEVISIEKNIKRIETMYMHEYEKNNIELYNIVKPEIESDVYFDVVIRQTKEILSKMNLEFNEKAIYRELCGMIEDNTLMVILNNEIPTLDLLSKEIGLTPRVISKYLQSLEKKGLIYRKEIYSTKAIYINPMFYSFTEQISKINKETLSYFNIDGDKCIISQCYNRYSDIL